MHTANNEFSATLPKIYSKSSFHPPSIEVVTSAIHRGDHRNHSMNLDMMLLQLNELSSLLVNSNTNQPNSVNWINVTTTVCKSLEVNLEYIKLIQGRGVNQQRKTLPRSQDLVSAQVASLSPSQLQIIRMAANGYTNKQIATNKGIKESSVSQQLSKAYKKLNVRSRLQAVSLCKQYGVI